MLSKPDFSIPIPDAPNRDGNPIEERDRRRAALGPRPEPLTCACGSRRAWAVWPKSNHPRAHLWGTNDPRADFYRPRYCPPAVNPCRDCRGQETDADRAAMLARQKAAGIPPKDRGWQWGKDTTTRQEPTETAAAFMARAIRAGRVGVYRFLFPVAQVVAEWTPDAGHSVFLHGPPGTGKTVFAAATANRLLRVAGEQERRERTYEELTAHPAAGGCGYSPEKARRILGSSRRFVNLPMAAGYSVLFTSEAALYDRIRLAWEKDRGPLGRVTRASALFLDDLGELGDGPNGPPGAREAIQRLIADRYARNAPLFITSNVPFERIGHWYGERVADRLLEMTRGGKHAYTLGNANWRAAHV